MLRPSLHLLGWLLAILTTASHAASPNIIVILSDDMGYSDIGCYGGEIQTPTLDRLAAGGVRFTQFYNTARCCPTRAALLTGLYSHQAGVGHMTDDHTATNGPAYAGELSRHAVTIAEVLQPAGYRTYMTGKWHVTRKTAPDALKHNWPLQRGFHRFYGTITGAGSFYDPSTLVRNNTMITCENDPEYQPKQYYYTDAIAENAVRYLKDHKTENADQPFFLYMAFTAAHWPMHALPEDIAKYRGKYDAGYDSIRQTRYAQLKKLGLVSSSTELSPTAGDWTSVAHREWELRCMEVYAAMIDRMDQGIGRVVQTLKEQGQLDNTLILYMQDNGGCAEGIGRKPNLKEVASAQHKPLAKDQFQPLIHPKQTRDGRPVRMGPPAMPGPADTYVAYGEAWANVSNTPFREYKHWQHEGGISTPLIAHWPAGIAASRGGQLEHQPAHLIDIMATCVDLGQATYPTRYADTEITPKEGVSLRSAFAGQSLQRPSPLFWEHEGNRAVRDGQWKLVSKHHGQKTGSWELYDIGQDRSEMHDLSSQHPDRVAAMSSQWDAWSKRVGVSAWPLGNKK
ncbi:MAG: arylsulfatase [Planctomycetota bacterium]|nr:MAG: arylsulfatase [Planctomycetota bacterium]